MKSFFVCLKNVINKIENIIEDKGLGIIRKNRRILYKYIIVTVGTLFMAIATVGYFEPLEVVTGGVTGVAILFKRIWGIPIWIINAAVNVPLFILGVKIFNRKVFVRTLYATFMLTLFLGVVPSVGLYTGDILVDVVVGSIIMGTGLGLVFVTYTSSGGTDLMAMLINTRIKYLSIPKIMAIIDSIIVCAGTGVFGIRKGIYAVIAIYVIQRVSNGILEGPNHAKQMCIITNNEIAISDYILNAISRGVTVLEARGGYTGECKKMLICVVSSREMIKIKQKLPQIDKNAMCFVGDIREAFGVGFTKIG